MYILSGIAMWGWQGYIFGYLGMRWMTVLYLLVVLVFSFEVFRRDNLGVFLSSWWQVKKELQDNMFAVFFGSVGLAAQLLFVIGTGWKNDEESFFYFLNSFDGVMHLAFTQELIQRFPAQQPGAVDIPLSHYHYWADLVAAEMSRIFGLPISFLTFQWLPFLLGICGTVVFYSAVKYVSNSKQAANWGLFWWFFAGNSLPFLYYFLHKEWNFSLPVIDHGLIQFSNTPQAFAKFLCIAGIILWGMWVKEKNWRVGLMSTLLLASLWGFKVYFGMFSVLGWTVYLFWLLFEYAKQHFKLGKRFRWSHFFAHFWKEIALYAIFGILCLVVYLPANVQAGGLFYVPLAWPKLIISSQYLDWNEWWLRRQVYEQYQNWKWLFIQDVAVILVFLVGVFSTRFLGVWAAWQVRKKMDAALWWFLFPTTILFIYIGMNFLQTSGEYNVFNFFVVALLPLTFFLSLWTPKLSRSFVGKILLLGLIVISLLSPAMHLITISKNYLAQSDRRVVRNSEQHVYNWIQRNTAADAIVQPPLHNTMNAETPWAPFFMNRQSYLAGTGILRSHNQPIQNREDEMKNFVICPGRSILAAKCTLPFDYIISERQVSERWIGHFCGVQGMTPEYFSEASVIWKVDHSASTCQCR